MHNVLKNVCFVVTVSATCFRKGSGSAQITHLVYSLSKDGIKFKALASAIPSRWEGVGRGYATMHIATPPCHYTDHHAPPLGGNLS